MDADLVAPQAEQGPKAQASLRLIVDTGDRWWEVRVPPGSVLSRGRVRVPGLLDSLSGWELLESARLGLYSGVYLVVKGGGLVLAFRFFGSVL